MRVLAIELTPRGFAFAILEGSERLVDWGGRRVSGDTSIFLTKLEALVGRYRPDALVVEEPAGSGRDRRGREWLAWAEEYAADHSLRRYAVTRLTLQSHFTASGQTKHAIAQAVARLFPEIAGRLPAPRRPWQSEPPGLGIFIATARGWVVLRELEQRATAAA